MEDQVFEQSEHKALKPHVCKICQKVISKGTTYTLTIGIFDSHFQSIHNHSACLNDREEYLNDQSRKEGCGEWSQKEF